MSKAETNLFNSEQKVTFCFCGKQFANRTSQEGNIKDAQTAFANMLRQNQNKVSAMYATMQHAR